MVPPSVWMRSGMFLRPARSGVCAGSNPWPSSSMCTASVPWSWRSRRVTCASRPASFATFWSASREEK